VSDTFVIGELPEVDRAQILRGYCPWCVERVVDRTLMNEQGDECPSCGDVFLEKRP
jgi:Zn-finger nucleic acid-binding protein